MWAIEVKAAKDIILSDHYENWNNPQLVQFIKDKRTNCGEFDTALMWVGDMTVKEALEKCNNTQWISWLKSHAPKIKIEVKEGATITITKGRDCPYALWGYGGIWDLPAEYVGETIKVISEN